MFSSRPRRPRRRLRKLLLAIVVFVVGLEVMLQVAAFVVSFTQPAAPQVQGAAVVCLGDSYTAGIGATSPDASYPAQLQEVLAERGSPVRVANGGCPGQDSAFLLRQVPALLRGRPRVLCVLMAFNDTWSRPARVAADDLSAREDYGRFAWRWRTGRLLALCLRFLPNSWHRTGADLVAAAGPAPTADPAAGFALLEGLGLLARDDPSPTFAPPQPAEVQRRVLEVERQLFVVDGGALALAERLATDLPDVAVAQKTLAVAAHLAGKSQRCAAALDALSRLAAGDDVADEQFVIALLATARPEQAAAAAREHLQRQPHAVVAALVLQDATYQLGQTDAFLPAALRALRLGARLFPGQAAMICRHLAVATASAQPQRAAGLLTAALLLDGNVALTRAKVQSVRGSVTGAHCDAAIANVPALAADQRDAVRGTLLAALADEEATAWGATLEHHLREVGRLCREQGTALVLLGYPFLHPDLERIQREVAAQLGVPFVPVRERFDVELQTRAREELFVPNGHCSDAGYRLLAELAADAVAPLLRR